MTHWPTDLAFDAAARVLHIAFKDGAAFDIPYELLRAESPSAEVRGHGAGPLPAVPGKQHVNVVKADPVGRYAVRIAFDDGHDTGLYSWEFLYELGSQAAERMQAHRARIAAL